MKVKLTLEVEPWNVEYIVWMATLLQDETDLIDLQGASIIGAFGVFLDALADSIHVAGLDDSGAAELLKLLESGIWQDLKKQQELYSSGE